MYDNLKVIQCNTKIQARLTSLGSTAPSIRQLTMPQVMKRMNGQAQYDEGMGLCNFNLLNYKYAGPMIGPNIHGRDFITERSFS